MKPRELYRTECNQRSKYFRDIASAYVHFYKCVISGKSVELWIVFGDTQNLLGKVCFN
jgi:hypothetical protein